MRAEELRRQELTEALVGLVRTAGTGSFPRITDKDRVFFRGLAVSGKADATEEQLAAARDEVLAMRKRMTAPKCVGCGGAPDLTGDFYLASVEDEDMEVRALKYVTLYTLRSLAPFVDRALSEGRTDQAVLERFYRTIFLLGTDLAEDDFIQSGRAPPRCGEAFRKCLNMAKYLRNRFTRKLFLGYYFLKLFYTEI